MTELLKKYLVIKWWIPLLFFGISFIFFITGIILPNTDFGFNLFAFSFLILLISSIWQIIKGKKKTGFALLSIAITPILALGSMVYLFAGTMNKPDGELALDRIEPLIKEKTDLIIPKGFEVLKNLIEHTEGAFDSDYSIGLIIEYKESDEQNIVEQILKSAEMESDKGSWKKYESGFDFEYNYNEINRAELFYFKVDTLNNKMELNLSHL
ncbi:hypothetical protein [Robertkochia solimangrovi]|uniref:hypothetical protein n=1 Tax=Robertkochia solimangrovi TaxID=2213046 RepID=UPI00117C4B7F|nr:hypothetical protein [Robertkochia solimangrovi]TRZ43150.1 hypothetical protein DMZ48_10680 [Robertkochia solimangrovi]